MPSKNDSPDNSEPQQPEPEQPDLFSSNETRAMLEEFRDLVRAGILRVTPENEVLPGTQHPGPAGAEKPAHPAASREADVAMLDKQLFEWLERKKRQKEEQARQERQEPEPAPVEHASESLLANLRRRVVDLVARKIVESWERAEQGPEPVHTLLDEVVERAADHLLRSLQSDPE